MCTDQNRFQNRFFQVLANDFDYRLITQNDRFSISYSILPKIDTIPYLALTHNFSAETRLETAQQDANDANDANDTNVADDTNDTDDANDANDTHFQYTRQGK